MDKPSIITEEKSLEFFNVAKRFEVVSKIAKKHGWHGIDFQKQSDLMIFKKGDPRIHVYLSKMTIITVIDHPKKGRNTLTRKKVYDIYIIESIFTNPRVHTGIGYHSKSETRMQIKKKANLLNFSHRKPEKYK